jgi:NAD(P)-dependent dehydrogenase (short-subunit alcohol dehydrogenase family)
VNQDASLRAKVAIITGASRGIGREFALELARHGMRLAVTARSEERLSALREELLALGAEVLALKADVADFGQCRGVAEAVLSTYGSVYALVNNAGVGMRAVRDDFLDRPVKFWEVPPEKFRHIMEVNAFGPFFMSQLVVPDMLKQGVGRIVNISTRGLTMARPEYIPYGPSKAALEAMTRAMALELRGSGVTVNALAPGGATDTEFFSAPPGQRRGADGKPALPANIMNEALVWLLSEASGAISGRRLVGRLWDRALPPDEAAAKAMPAQPDEPVIL